MTETSWIRPGIASRPSALTCTSTRYTVLERLGQGGTATVHRAIEHRADGWQREVAIKRLFPHLAEDDDFVRCFVREADMASRLEHPNIARIYKLGRGGTGYFISMELVPGRDLRRVMARASKRRMTPPLDVVLSLLWELCDALAYAHERGVVHRDVSPANLLIHRNGTLKVIDFGIARAVARDDETQHGLAKGKFPYMSPEATRCEELDHRADIFSAGVIAYELLTMEPLFAGRTDLETVARVREARVQAPSSRNHNVPVALDAIVLTALARDPARRFASAAAMRDAIGELAARLGVDACETRIAWLESLFPLATGSNVGPGPL